MKRAAQNLSHMRLQSFDMGNLMPIGVMEVLPGDTYRHQVSALLRVTPLVAPVMHPVKVRVHSWFVPIRLIWENWETFIADPDSGLTCPIITLNTSASQLTADFIEHMGVGHDIVPATSGATQQLNSLPFRAFNKIINEFYIDQQLDTPLTENIDDGPDALGDYTLHNGNWPKDYFTVARPEPALGGDVDATVGGGGTTLNINELRRAMAEQRIREHRNRFGSRYRDYLAFLGVRPSDGRLDRPEYLGGGRQTIAFSEVLSTQASGAGLGDLGGHGIAAISTRPYKRFFEEHGYIITLMHVCPVPMYQNMIPKKYLRTTWDTFWQKEYEIRGDQAIANEELYYQHSSPAAAFGYIPRHDDYRSEKSSVSGDFRSVLGNLDYWHYARNFTSNPSLNSTFITSTPTDRVYVDTDQSELFGMIRHRVTARRLVRRRGEK